MDIIHSCNEFSSCFDLSSVSNGKVWLVVGLVIDFYVIPRRYPYPNAWMLYIL